MQINRMHNVRYVTIEGLDATGKDTHTLALSEKLRAQGYDTYIAHHGYDSDYGNDILNAVMRSEMSGESELAMLFTMWYLNLIRIHRDLETRRKVNPSTHRRCFGTVVIFNRFIDSTYVYQVGMNGADPAMYERYYTEILNRFTVDFTVVLTALPATIIERANTRSFGDPIDKKEIMSMTHHERMQKLYEQHLIVRKHAFISTENSIVEVQKILLNTVLEALDISVE